MSKASPVKSLWYDIYIQCIPLLRLIAGTALNLLRVPVKIINEGKLTISSIDQVACFMMSTSCVFFARSPFSRSTDNSIAILRPETLCTPICQLM